MNIFVLFILGYLLYRFIGGFLIPVFRTTRHMRQQFHNMNNQPGQEGNTSNGHQSTANPSSSSGAVFGGRNGQGDNPNSGPSKVGEYIDFEEIK